MTFISIVAVVIYFILIAWTWQSLGFIEKQKKIILILIGFVFMYGLTFVIFQMAQNGVTYDKVEIQQEIQKILVIIFTGINGLLVMPQIGKILDKMNEDEMEKEELIKRIILLIVIFALCSIFESGYMKDTQEGILKIYHTIKH